MRASRDDGPERCTNLAAPSQLILSRSGFTLIELLVVIAVIPILASLLLPGLSRAKSAARNAECFANLKQWGLALTMYLEDYHQYPLAFAIDADGKALSGEELVALYFNDQNQTMWFNVRCRQRWKGEGLTYRYNNFAQSWMTLLGTNLSLGGDFIRQVPLPEGAVRVPLETIAFTESVLLREPKVTSGAFAGYAVSYPLTGREDLYPHGKGLNQAFCDGHVGAVSKKQIGSKTDAILRRWYFDNKPHRELWFNGSP